MTCLEVAWPFPCSILGHWSRGYWIHRNQIHLYGEFFASFSTTDALWVNLSSHFCLHGWCWVKIDSLWCGGSNGICLINISIRARRLSLPRAGASCNLSYLYGSAIESIPFYQIFNWIYPILPTALTFFPCLSFFLDSFQLPLISSFYTYFYILFGLLCTLTLLGATPFFLNGHITREMIGTIEGYWFIDE